MSLKDFKKIGSNDKFTTFKHPNGSFLKVAHKGITKDYKKKLDSLPMHPEQMEIKGGGKSLSSIPPMHQEQGPGTNFSNVNNMPRMAEGGGIGGENQPMFHGVKNKIYEWSGRPEGGAPLPQEVKGNPAEIDMPGRTEEPVYQDVSGPVQSEDIKMAAGGDVSDYKEYAPDLSADDIEDLGAPIRDKNGNVVTKFGRGEKQMAKDKGIVSKYPIPSEQADPSTQGAIGSPSPLAVPVNNDEAVSLAKASPYSTPSGMADFAKGYETQLGGLQKQQEAARLGAQANIGLAQQESTTYGVGINQLNNFNNSFMQHYGALQDERQKLMQEMNAGAQHLDPFRYVKSMSTGDKILSGIGLVLGGIGSGMTHGPNLAADFLQRNIDRDIENQRLQLGVKQNLLGFNFQQTKDLQDATNFTKLNSMDMVSMYLKRQAAQAQSPLQQSALLNQAGLIDQKAGELQAEIAKRRTFMQLSTQGGAGSEQAFQAQNGMLRTFGEEGEKLAKDRESKHVAGVGQASRTVPDDVLKEITARQDFDNAIRDLQTFGAQHSGSISPATIREGEAKAKIVQDKARQANAQGVFKESENEFMNSIINDNPTQLFEKYRAGKGYEEARKSNLMYLNARKKSYGLPVTQEQEQAQQSPQEVERKTKDGKIAIFDGNTKKFLRWK